MFQRVAPPAHTHFERLDPAPFGQRSQGQWPRDMPSGRNEVIWAYGPPPRRIGTFLFRAFPLGAVSYILDPSICPQGYFRKFSRWLPLKVVYIHWRFVHISFSLPTSKGGDQSSIVLLV